MRKINWFSKSVYRAEDTSIKRFRKTTIKDVAAQAGVSTTTVSLFVSGKENVCSPETAERIRRAVSALNYTPSFHTSSLGRKASMTIGVCLTSPLDPDVAFAGWYLEQLWRGVFSQADEDGYSVLHYPIALRNGSSHEVFLDGRVDGIVLQAHHVERAAFLSKAGLPVVMLGRSLDIPEGCGAACSNEAQTVDLALSHLWALGHRRIAHIAGPVGDRAPYEVNPPLPQIIWHDDVAIQRLDEYTAWMRKRGVFDPSLIAYAQAWTATESPEILRRWLASENPPTAVFCANDAQAIDLLAAAREQGCRIPDDLSVVSVDNSVQARESDPPLTAIQIPLDEIGREGIKALLRLSNGAPAEECRVAVPVTQLVVRKSTAALR